MRNRTISLLLALVLTMSAILPLPSLAAGKEPVVLKSLNDGYDHISYRYYEDGSLAIEENGSDTTVYTYWSNGKPASEKYYSDGELCREIRYDRHGNMELTREITEDGGTRTQVGEAEYDDYGRLKTHRVAGWYDGNGKPEEEYSVETVTVTYADEDSDGPVIPESEVLKTVRVKDTYRDESDLHVRREVTRMEYSGGSLRRENVVSLANGYGLFSGSDSLVEYTTLYDSHGTEIYNIYIESRGSKYIAIDTTWENKYNSAGQLISRAETYNADTYLTHRYKYDKAGRLISEVVTDRDDPSGVFTDNAWSYDKKGNLLSYSEKGELLEEYTYDANGNLRFKLLTGKAANTYYTEHQNNVPYSKRQEKIRLEYQYVPLSQVLWDGEL